MKSEESLLAGFHRMRTSRLPGMVLIYKTWCPVCTELKSLLVGSTEVDYLSNYIVIVMLKDDDEPTDPAYAPDGSYIPRIFFTAPNGAIMYNIVNSNGDPRYKYFYSTDKELIPNMRRVINLYPVR